jgi:hypothetical protein
MSIYLIRDEKFKRMKRHGYTGVIDGQLTVMTLIEGVTKIVAVKKIGRMSLDEILGELGYTAQRDKDRKIHVAKGEEIVFFSVSEEVVWKWLEETKQLL